MGEFVPKDRILQMRVIRRLVDTAVGSIDEIIQRGGTFSSSLSSFAVDQRLKREVGSARPRSLYVTDMQLLDLEKESPRLIVEVANIEAEDLRVSALVGIQELGWSSQLQIITIPAEGFATFEFEFTPKAERTHTVQFKGLCSVLVDVKFEYGLHRLLPPLPVEPEPEEGGSTEDGEPPRQKARKSGKGRG